MQKKFVYLASVIPAALLCTQLAACTADGSIYGSQPWTPASSSSVSSTTQKLPAKIHSAPLQTATYITPTAPCNTLQLAGNAVQPALASIYKKRRITPATHCQSTQSTSGKIVLP